MGRVLDVVEFMTSSAARVITGDELDEPQPQPKVRPKNWKRDQRAKNKAARASRKRNRVPK